MRLVFGVRVMAVAMALTAGTLAAPACARDNAPQSATPQTFSSATRFTAGSNFTVNQNSWGPDAAQGLAWSRSRFGLTVDFGAPQTRAEDANDVAAGAYYRITPSLRLGGQLKLGTTGSAATRAAQPDEREPRLRFETAFQF